MPQDHAIKLLEMVKTALLRKLRECGVVAGAEDVVRAATQLDPSLAATLAEGGNASVKVEMRSILPKELMDELRAEGARAETQRLEAKLRPELEEEAREQAAREVAEALRAKDAALAEAQRGSAALGKELDALRQSAEEAAAQLEESRAEARASAVAEAKAVAAAEERRRAEMERDELAQRIAAERDELREQLEAALREAKMGAEAADALVANSRAECERRVYEVEVAGANLASESERAAGVGGQGAGL